MTEDWAVYQGDALLHLREMRGVVQLCEPGGVILDPFAGSGSTIEAALLEGYRAVGIEQEQHNIDIIHRRLAGVQMRMPLPDAVHQDTLRGV